MSSPEETFKNVSAVLEQSMERPWTLGEREFGGIRPSAMTHRMAMEALDGGRAANLFIELQAHNNGSVEVKFYRGAHPKRIVLILYSRNCREKGVKVYIYRQIKTPNNNPGVSRIAKAIFDGGDECATAAIMGMIDAYL